MKIQTYSIVRGLGLGESVNNDNLGQVVYEWPHADWGLAGPEDVLICTKLDDVTTIYAVPRSCLQAGEVIDAPLNVADMPGSPQPTVDFNERSNCILYAAYDSNGKVVVTGSRSTFDPHGDMRIADAAWELTYARRRGVSIDDATFTKHVTGEHLYGKLGKSNS